MKNLLVSFFLLLSVLGVNAQRSHKALAAWIAEMPYSDTLIMSLSGEVDLSEAPVVSVNDFDKADGWDSHSDIPSKKYLGYSHVTKPNGLVMVSAFGDDEKSLFLLVFSQDSTLVSILPLSATFEKDGLRHRYGSTDQVGKTVTVWKVMEGDEKVGKERWINRDSTFATYKFLPTGKIDTVSYDRRKKREIIKR